MRRAFVVLAALALAGCPGSGAEKGPGPGQAPVSTDTTSGPPATTRGWPGKYTGEALTVTVSEGSGGLDMTMEKAGKTYELIVLKYAGDTVNAAFKVEGTAFDLKLERNGDELTVSTDKSTYALKRFVPPNPLDAPNPLDEPAPPKNPLDEPAPPKNPLGEDPPTNPLGEDPPTKLAAGGETPVKKPADPTDKVALGGEDLSTWQHHKTPEGHEVRYPKGWRAQGVAQNIASLIPPDMALDKNGGPEEACYLEVAPAGAFKSPDEPGAVRALEGRVGEIFPYMRRTGELMTLEVRGRKAVELSFSGTSPAGGTFEARLFAVIINQHAMLLLVAAKPEQLQKRLPTARTIFGTYDSKLVVKTDPNMVGQWRHTSTYVSGDFSTVSEEYLLLKADGSCFWASKFMGGGAAGTFDAGGSGQWEHKGRWSVEGRTLTMRWEAGGVEVKHLTRSGNSFMWKISKSKNKLWERVGN